MENSVTTHEAQKKLKCLEILPADKAQTGDEDFPERTNQIVLFNVQPDYSLQLFLVADVQNISLNQAYY